jgi:hypothetical protein
MCDSAQVLAARIDGDATQRAADVLTWLIERGIVEEQPSASSYGGLAHRPGPNVADAVAKPPPRMKNVADFRRLAVNGMNVEYTRRPRLQTSGDEMPDFMCPRCDAALDPDNVFPLLDDLDSEIACPKCNEQTAVVDLRVENGTFANLVFRFWNWWPLDEEFVADLAKRCGAPIVVLYERV